MFKFLIFLVEYKKMLVKKDLSLLLTEKDWDKFATCSVNFGAGGQELVEGVLRPICLIT